MNNQPDWWLIHMGEIMALLCVLVFAGMFLFIYYTEKHDQEERDAKLKAQAETKKKE